MGCRKEENSGRDSLCATCRNTWWVAKWKIESMFYLNSFSICILLNRWIMPKMGEATKVKKNWISTSGNGNRFVCQRRDGIFPHLSTRLQMLYVLQVSLHKCKFYTNAVHAGMARRLRGNTNIANSKSGVKRSTKFSSWKMKILFHSSIYQRPSYLKMQRGLGWWKEGKGRKSESKKKNSRSVKCIWVQARIGGCHSAAIEHPVTHVEQQPPSYME